ncbi:uncharacterized protein LOC111316734 isoform X2 [Durio zibethinus]|uniref:Uncharacterized protein LOC111316734 isoform X2 n=1 Tax=Durio zibethinus TaxID=66656 RepID=A0A6P6BBT3_DURZI|nr:uncharacterized protein LOC111316734 isoform X2 [Durio zibethinus]
MDVRKVVVVVEDLDVARAALQWTLHNLLRYGDLLTLLLVFSPPKSRSKKKARLLRLQGYQLALSFKEICNSNFFNTNIEMIVTEGDQEGGKIVAMVREIGASVLVVGLHDHSFLYKVPDIPSPKIPYRICPSPSAIIWRLRKSRKMRSYSNGA